MASSFHTPYWTSVEYTFVINKSDRILILSEGVSKVVYGGCYNKGNVFILLHIRTWRDPSYHDWINKSRLFKPSPSFITILHVHKHIPSRATLTRLTLQCSSGEGHNSTEKNVRVSSVSNNWIIVWNITSRYTNATDCSSEQCAVDRSHLSARLSLCLSVCLEGQTTQTVLGQGDLCWGC